LGYFLPANFGNLSLKMEQLLKTIEEIIERNKKMAEEIKEELECE
jgi:predicted ATP-grasp superfamily ATP-dependent carboligase